MPPDFMVYCVPSLGPASCGVALLLSKVKLLFLGESQWSPIVAQQTQCTSVSCAPPGFPGLLPLLLGCWKIKDYAGLGAEFKVFAFSSLQGPPLTWAQSHVPFLPWSCSQASLSSEKRPTGKIKLHWYKFVYNLLSPVFLLVSWFNFHEVCR